MALKHHLVQEVDQTTHCASILDLVWTNDQHIVSSVVVEDWPLFTDHKVVLAHTTFEFGRKLAPREEVHLLFIEAILRIKENPKAFFSFAKSRQQTKSRIGPFLDGNGLPNQDPKFAASATREAWTISDINSFFSLDENCSESAPSLSDISFSEESM